MTFYPALRRFLCVSTCLSLPGLAVAQDFMMLDDILVRANLEATDPDRSGSTVHVATGEDLATAPYTRLGAALAQMPGLSFKSNGPAGTASTITLRGAPAQYVPVLLDGIEMGDPAAGKGDFDFGTLGVAGIDRVEVLTGAQSALYGSNAVGGVINLTSFRAQELGTAQRFAVEYGSYATQKISYAYAAKTERGEVSVTLSHLSSNGFSAKEENDGNFEPDGFRANRIGFFGQYQVTDAVTVGLNGFFEDSRGENDVWSGDTAANIGQDYTDRRATGLRAFTEITAGAFDHKIEASYYRSDRQSYSYGATAPSDFDGKRVKLSYTGAADLGASARVIFGADRKRESVEGEGSVTTLGVFSELNWAVSDRADLSATLRHDDHETYGGFTSARLSGVYRLQEDLLLRASLGNGFRAPSLYELYGPYGDAAMAVEKSTSAELGVEKRWGEAASLRATAFWLEAKNLIGFDYAATSCGQAFGCYAQVPGTTRRSGLELEAEAAVTERLTLKGNYTYIQSAGTGMAANAWAGVARHDLNLSAEMALTPDWTGLLTVERVIDRPGTLANYTVANAGVRYDFGAGKQAYLHIENLFDEEYQTISGYGASDRAVYVGFRAQF
ncbi:vitamin B12 transporter [Rhodobacter sp. JA431]|uniref:TonB-dependent receptor plug domain-containing protein n=1 Tax=Rhodobacter sp. JA431 TaxID=570013 RepID=UPI000BDD4C10|nr:TonB-dependent receptor [Rhodobacter sp. JA431]SOC05020.1 vitamin B12 transporter [Rhodobacter sp. JA431]